MCVKGGMDHHTRVARIMTALAVPAPLEEIRVDKVF